jgi:hypothetical protein
MSNRRVAYRLQRLLLRYDQRLAELQEQRRRARRERMEAWERLSAIRSQQAEMDLAIAPRSNAPAFSWQMERCEEQRKARKRARAERALRETTGRALYTMRSKSPHR